jgi:hypothetical protein
LAVTKAKPLAAANRARKARADERAAKLIPIIAKLQAEGVATLIGLAAALNERRILTPEGQRKWRPEQVSRLLRRLKMARSDIEARGRPPFGFDAVNGRLVPNDSEQAALARMIQLRRKGASFRQISVAIAQEFRRLIQATSVRRILNRPAP